LQKIKYMKKLLIGFFAVVLISSCQYFKSQKLQKSDITSDSKCYEDTCSNDVESYTEFMNRTEKELQEYKEKTGYDLENGYEKDTVYDTPVSNEYDYISRRED